MFSREINITKQENGKFELRWKVSEGFYQVLVLSASELEKIISQYRVIK